MNILCSVRSRGDQGSMGWGGGMDGEKAGVGGLGDWQGVATQRFAA